MTINIDDHFIVGSYAHIFFILLTKNPINKIVKY